MEAETRPADARRGVDRAFGKGRKPARVVVVPVGKNDRLRQRPDAERGGVPRERTAGARVEQKAAGTRADRYTILNETDLSDERLGKLYDQMEEVFGA